MYFKLNAYGTTKCGLVMYISYVYMKIYNTYDNKVYIFFKYLKIILLCILYIILFYTSYIKFFYNIISLKIKFISNYNRI